MQKPAPVSTIPVTPGPHDASAASTAYGTAASLVRPTDAPSTKTSTHTFVLACTAAVHASGSEIWKAPACNIIDEGVVAQSWLPPVAASNSSTCTFFEPVR